MRSREEVMEKFVEVRDAKLRERKQEYLGRKPINCASNERVRVKGRGQIGICKNKAVCATHGLFPCNDEDTARKCLNWSCRNTDRSVEREFMEVLRSPARCGEEYPKLAMLIWFLQEFEVAGRTARFGALVRQAGGALWRVVSFRWW